MTGALPLFPAGEFLLRLTTGSRVFRLGDANSIPLGPDVETVIAHTHPSGVLEFSEPDINSLTRRGQPSSVLIDPKSATEYCQVEMIGGWANHYQI